MTIHDLAEYEILDEHRVEDVQSDGFILRHKKSGARIAILSNNDDNKVFYIGFRTPPEDETDTVLSEQQLNGLSAGNWEKIKINKSDDGYSFCESLDKSYNKYIVYIKIVDNSGNVKYISTEGAIIDNEAPEITEVNIVDSDKNKLEDENADLWKQSKVCLQVKATDNLSGIDRYEYKLEGLKDNGTATGTVKLKDTKLGNLE